ncbi:MAG: hypothetical protein ACREQQ_00345 [Candidatus Binatia bacterium]
MSCPLCRSGFDLFRSRWCHHENGSKVCPHCGRCPCALPEYDDPACWGEPPLAFRQNGFKRLFLFYI